MGRLLNESHWKCRQPSQAGNVEDGFTYSPRIKFSMNQHVQQISEHATVVHQSTTTLWWVATNFRPQKGDQCSRAALWPTSMLCSRHLKPASKVAQTKGAMQAPLGAAFAHMLNKQHNVAFFVCTRKPFDMFFPQPSMSGFPDCRAHMFSWNLQPGNR